MGVAFLNGQPLFSASFQHACSSAPVFPILRKKRPWFFSFWPQIKLESCFLSLKTFQISHVEERNHCKIYFFLLPFLLRVGKRKIWDFFGKLEKLFEYFIKLPLQDNSQVRETFFLYCVCSFSTGDDAIWISFILMIPMDTFSIYGFVSISICYTIVNSLCTMEGFFKKINENRHLCILRFSWISRVKSLTN